MRYTGNVVQAGDYATWISLEYANRHPGKECDQAFNTSAFSITNSFGNRVDGAWDGVTEDHGGLVESKEEPAGSGRHVLLSDIVLTNPGPEPAAIYLLCLEARNRTGADLDLELEGARPRSALQSQSVLPQAEFY